VPEATGWGWSFAALASASIVEELVFRGLLIPAGISVGLSAIVALALSSVLFGVAHLYQGPAAVVFTGLLGFILGYALLLTGSLLPAVAIHFLLDMRAFVIFRMVASANPPARLST
jgi:membrane protease YdiL (CAAX protease family)